MQNQPQPPGSPVIRPKINPQTELDFQPSNLRVTNEHRARYAAISKILDANPEILDAVHRDLKRDLEELQACVRPGQFRYSSDTVLRILVVQQLEGLSLRQVVVRIDDSHTLRRFTRIDSGPMMDFSTLCDLKNAIRPGTWKRINRRLAVYAVKEERITGDLLRLDTTAVETNIHWPTDSSLLWDVYRTLGRWIERARNLDAEAVGRGRVHLRAAKRTHLAITRKSRKGRSSETLKPLYERLIGHVEGICEWAMSAAAALAKGIEGLRYSELEHAKVESLIEQIAHLGELSVQIVDQARRRVLLQDAVPNGEKLFSLFEPHTELLKRGKVGQPIEFGHMIGLQQTEEKFITDYTVFEHKPVEHTLIQVCLAQHETLFGMLPEQLAADKGYYESMDAIHALERDIPVVSIGKKGKRTPEETQRERDPLFRMAQAFRAGIEGTISYLKRMLRLARCMNKGWEHFQASVGATIFAHNLVVLARP